MLVLPGAEAGEEVAVDAKLGGEGFPNNGVELDQLLGGRGVEPEGRVAIDHLQCFIMFCMYLLLIFLSNFKSIFKAGRFTSAPSFSKTAPLSRMSCSEGFCNTCHQVLFELLIYFGTCN